MDSVVSLYILQTQNTITESPLFSFKLVDGRGSQMLNLVDLDDLYILTKKIMDTPAPRTKSYSKLICSIEPTNHNKSSDAPVGIGTSCLNFNV